MGSSEVSIVTSTVAPLPHLHPIIFGQPASYYSPSVRQKFPDLLSDITPPQPQSSHYADIGYKYDERKHNQRTVARLHEGDLRTDLPAGWPKVLKGPLAWTTSDYQEESSFVYSLTNSDKAEIINALEHFKSSGITEKDIGRDCFPLQRLGQTLAGIRADLYTGRGFATLRGLDVDTFTPDDLATVYLGLTSYIAEKRGKQNQQGVMMINVVNNKKEMELENSTVEMPFHTDLVCDTVALLTVSCGKEGGSGVIASAWTVYNELAATRPDLIHVLAEPNWPFDTHGRSPPYYMRALLHLEDGKIITNFSRRLLVGHNVTGPRTSRIPGLTEAQAEALDALHAIGRRHEIQQTIMKGDIRLMNNLGIMHRRNKFVDDTDNHRHLLRLWLHSPSFCWQLPADLRIAWERVFNDHERPEHWHFVEFGSAEPSVNQLWAKQADPKPEPVPPDPVVCD